MIVKPYLVIDSEFLESVGSYGATIDKINGTTDFSTKLNSLVAANEAQSNSSEDDNEEELEQEIIINEKFYPTILDSVKLLAKLSDKDLESVLNLVFYLVSDPLSEDSISRDELLIKRFKLLLSEIVKISPKSNPAFNDKTSIKFATIISCLTIFFNLIESTSELRFEILNTILKVTGNLDKQSLKENLHLILPLSKKSTINYDSFIFENFLKDCQTNDLEIIEFAYKLANLLDSTYHDEALIVLKFTLIKYYSTKVSKDIINSLAQKALNNPKEIDLSYFTKFETFKDEALLKLSEQYTHTSLDSFKSLISSSSASYNNINTKILITKKEFLLIANMALKSIELSSSEANISPFITYKQISDELGYSNDLIKIESILINSIKLNIFIGKIDQIKQIFTISKLNLIIVANEENNNKLGKNEWKFILNNLKNWRNSLNEANEVIDQQKKRLTTSNVN